LVMAEGVLAIRGFLVRLRDLEGVYSEGFWIAVERARARARAARRRAPRAAGRRGPGRPAGRSAGHAEQA